MLKEQTLPLILFSRDGDTQKRLETNEALLFETVLTYKMNIVILFLCKVNSYESKHHDAKYTHFLKETI